MEDQTKNGSDKDPACDHDTSKDPIYAARDHDKQFDPLEYLEGFYKTAKEDEAMQIVLFFLPGVLYRLPNMIGDLLDLGAGPTVYIPIAVRNRVKNVYTSDYAETNRNMLQNWIEEKNSFDWSNVCTWISSIEGSVEKPPVMQAHAREKMRAVLEVNVHKQPVVQSVHYKSPTCSQIPQQFDVITTVFCLEYASETLEEYSGAVKNAVTLIKPGGFLVQGGVLNADEYSFGGRRFRCHHLTKEQLLKCLKLMNNRNCNQHACTSFDDAPPPLLFRGFDVNSCYNDLHVDTELSMVNSPCTSISDTTPPPIMDKSNLSSDAMKQLVVEQPVNVNGDGVKVLNASIDNKRKNPFFNSDNIAKAQYSRKRKAPKAHTPVMMEATTAEPKEFTGFDDNNAGTSNEGDLSMPDQFTNAYDGNDSSMMSYAHPMVNQVGRADDSNEIRVDAMSPPNLGRQSVGTENESVAGDSSKKQTLYSTAQKSVQKARQRNLTAFAKRHRSITKKVLLSTRQATIFNGTSHFHRFTKTKNFMATVPAGEMQSVLPRYAENCAVITETNPCTVTGNAFYDETCSQISANDLNSVVSQGFAAVPPTLSDALAITACSWTVDMLKASSALYSYSPSAKIGIDESTDLIAYDVDQDSISSAVNEDATLMDTDDPHFSITEVIDNFGMENVKDAEIHIGNGVNTKDRKKSNVNDDFELMDAVMKKSKDRKKSDGLKKRTSRPTKKIKNKKATKTNKSSSTERTKSKSGNTRTVVIPMQGTTFRVRKDDENCYISGMTCMRRPKTDDLSVCTLMLPRPEDEITRPRRRRRKEGYSIDLVKDVVNCFPQRPFFIKGRVCFETVNEETRKVLKFYGKTPETARKLEKNDFSCFTGAAWYRAQFREVAVRSRPVMLPPVDAKKERTFDPYKRKLAAKCIYKPIPMPKHIEIPLTAEWLLPMPPNYKEVSQKYADFLYREHDLRKPVEYDCHWGEYFVPRETEHQNVSFSESLLRGDTVLVDEYTPLKFDSMPSMESDVVIPKPSKSKKSTSKKTRKEKINANKSPMRKSPHTEIGESSKSNRLSTPKCSNFRLNPACGNSSKPFNSNVFEITPAGSSKPLPIKGALPPDEKANDCDPHSKQMDDELGLKQPEVESEEDGEFNPDSSPTDQVASSKNDPEVATTTTAKEPLRRSNRRSTTTVKPNGVSESDDIIETKPSTDNKTNGSSNIEPMEIEVTPRKSSVKPKSTKSHLTLSRVGSDEDGESISEDSETAAAKKPTKPAVRRSVRKSTTGSQSNEVSENNGTADAKTTSTAKGKATVDIELDVGVPPPKQKSITVAKPNKPLPKGISESDEKGNNSIPGIESVDGEDNPRKARKSSVKSKTKGPVSLSQTESKEGGEFISECLPIDNAISPKIDPQADLMKVKKQSVRRSIRRSGTGIKANGISESDIAEARNDLSVAKVKTIEMELDDSIPAAKRKQTSDEEGPLPKKRRSRPVQRYEPPY